MRRRPPPLAIASALAGAWRAAAVAGIAVPVAVTAAWLSAALAGTLRPSPHGLAGALVAGVLAAAVAWLALPRDGGHLSYDGAGWRLSRPGTSSSPADLLEGHPVIALDLGHWMLLRFEPLPVPAARGLARGHGRCSAPGNVRRSHWLPIAAATDIQAWPALRAALWTWRPGRDPSPHA